MIINGLLKATHLFSENSHLNLVSVVPHKLITIDVNLLGVKSVSNSLLLYPLRIPFKGRYFTNRIHNIASVGKRNDSSYLIHRLNDNSMTQLTVLIHGIVCTSFLRTTGYLGEEQTYRG